MSCIANLAVEYVVRLFLNVMC